MIRYTVAIGFVVFALIFSVIWACALTWAFCFIVGLFGVTIGFSWKLALAIWIISGLFASIKIKQA